MDFITGVTLVDELLRCENWVFWVSWILVLISIGVIVFCNMYSVKRIIPYLCGLLMLTVGIALPLLIKAGIIPFGVYSVKRYVVCVNETVVDWNEFHKVYTIVDYSSGLYTISLKDPYDAAKIDAAE